MDSTLKVTELVTPKNKYTIFYNKIPVSFGSPYVWSWFVKIHARDVYVNTHAMSLVRVTAPLLSSRLVRAAQSCRHKHVDFQQWNVSSLIFWFKVLTDLVSMHRALYQLGHNSSFGVRVEPSAALPKK